MTESTKTIIFAMWSGCAGLGLLYLGQLMGLIGSLGPSGGY